MRLLAIGYVALEFYGAHPRHNRFNSYFIKENEFSFTYREAEINTDIYGLLAKMGFLDRIYPKLFIEGAAGLGARLVRTYVTGKNGSQMLISNPPYRIPLNWVGDDYKGHVTLELKISYRL